MFFGLVKDTDERIYIDDAISIKEKKEYICPVCKGKLRIKNGKVNAPHFAHVNLEDCDTFAHDMSVWHYKWQSEFPEKTREQVLTYNGEVHRADVLVGNFVIEFQHSPIKMEEFEARNVFYTKCGYHLIWVFDFSDRGGLSIEDKKGNQIKWEWKSPVRFMDNFRPQENRKVTVLFDKINDNSEMLYQILYARETNPLQPIGYDYEIDLNAKYYVIKYKGKRIEEIYVSNDYKKADDLYFMWEDMDGLYKTKTIMQQEPPELQKLCKFDEVITKNGITRERFVTSFLK